jgi:FtsP/CotA-like multicopper oxidase with cupredoxin domain
MRKLLSLAATAAICSLNAQSYYNPLAIPPAITGTGFNLTVADSSHHFFGSNNTPTYGVNGEYLGPTLIVNKNDSINIAVNNNLSQSTTMHWHGMHVPAAMDGGPHTVIAAGSTWNVGFKVRNEASTNWYHPHLHTNTGSQVYMGIAGMLIVKDTVESQLNLPRTYGVDDVPVVLQDRSFLANGDFIVEGLADSMVVNGTMHAYLDAPAQVVRLRLLNGSNVRAYNIGFSDNRTFYIIASDGGLLEQPVAVTRLKISGGERYEILLDLTNDLGNNFTMMSYASAFTNTEPGGGGMPNGTSPLNAVDYGIMQINVVAATANPVTTIPASLITLNPWQAANANTIRYKTLDGNGMFATMANFTINNLAFDMMVINDTIPLNNLEIWQFTNNTNIAHPMHIHDVQFYILSRNGNAPPAYETGLKDVFYIMPGEVVQVIMKFEDFADETMPYMYHCHNLVHEDNEMMAQFIVSDSLTSVNEVELVSCSFYPNPTAQSVTLQFAPGATNNYQIELVNASGQLISSSAIAVTPGNTTYTVDCSAEPAGIYFLRVSAGNGVKVLKIVKE